MKLVARMSKKAARLFAYVVFLAALNANPLAVIALTLSAVCCAMMSDLTEREAWRQRLQ